MSPKFCLVKLLDGLRQLLGILEQAILRVEPCLRGILRQGRPISLGAIELWHGSSLSRVETDLQVDVDVQNQLPNVVN